MNLSGDWRSLFPVASVFAPPSAARSRGPLLFSPLPPAVSLLSLPFPIPPPPQLASSRGLHRFLRAYVTATSFLPLADLDSLASDLLAPPPSPFPPPSNLLAVLRRPSSSPSWSLLIFFPYGENAEQVAFITLDSDTVAGSTPASPVVQGQGFRHPGQSIRLLAASTAESFWSSRPGDKLVEGFLLAATLYSVNWFRIESHKSNSPALVPVAKQGFDAAIVHACWSRHLPSECIVLLENGELCWFNLDSCHGGKMRVDLGSKDDCGNWLSCDYGAKAWMVIIATSKSVLLVDLRFASRGEYKVIAKVGTLGVYETDLFTGADQYLAFCRAGFDHFHYSVVTERFLILLDVRQPLKPLLAWQHGLENPNNVAMFRLSELWPSKEHELALKSGFAILVGSFFTGEFSISALHCSDGIVKDVLSLPVSRDGSDPQENKSLTIGYYVLPYDISVLEPSYAGFALIRLTSLGKLEIQRYRKSTDVCDVIPCQRILNGLPSNILCVTFSKYKDMVACSGERAAEHLDVPSLMRNELRPFLLAKPSSISDNLTSKVLRRDPLVGPVLPIHVLLAMEQRNKDVESSSQDALDEIDSVSDQCREVLEAFDHVISIADSFGSQGVDDEKSYFAYEPRIEIRFSSDSARKNRKGDQNLDDSLHTSATTNQDKIFTTFVCGKTEIPESGPAQAAASILDIGPCCLQITFITVANATILSDTEIVGLHCNFWKYRPLI
ncbi:hypothetical protein PR202_gb19185 [Eleusine coracana subsp. coracana]|uniref:Uncharacterized protein n=1 Tax=Eleusine coracana subsp. coracana TaxID=191504 RepID=A0AAV5F849_ELECO|nr:hypothetical protein PR202_gb19185 [Eleusine coracana subsp. coracana]